MHTDLPHHHESPEKLEKLDFCIRNIADFNVVSDIFRLLSDPTRIRIFWLLCHCEECVLDISAMLGMSSPAVSHHLRQLRDNRLIVSRRRGKEVYYRAANSETALLLHEAIEQIMEISCPKDAQLSEIRRLPALDAHTGAESAGYPPEQLETIRAIHDELVEHLSQRTTIEELSHRYLMNPSTMKALFRAVYGNSIAAHVREHRMEAASRLLAETERPVAEIARAVGYESQSRFSAEFRKQFSLLPTEYRRAHRS